VFQIKNDERCNGYCEKRISYFQSRRQTWSQSWELLRKFEFNTPWKNCYQNNDDSLDMLNFLRVFFKTENNWLLIEQDCKLKFLCLHLIFFLFFSTEFDQWIKKFMKICVFSNFGSKILNVSQSRCQYRDPGAHKIQYRNPGSEKMVRYCML
jgi:hypothetical protein